MQFCCCWIFLVMNFNFPQCSKSFQIWSFSYRNVGEIMRARWRYTKKFSLPNDYGRWNVLKVQNSGCGFKFLARQARLFNEERDRSELADQIKRLGGIRWLRYFRFWKREKGGWLILMIKSFKTWMLVKSESFERRLCVLLASVNNVRNDVVVTGVGWRTCVEFTQ